eukprot:TRINITY_DN25361_c0_g2_i1.p1 TRINITY_DN25361_c0_g2~~TRINITY_DN25361_c0_g2_i1.p1  ORF type:complete len:202 (-),score=26.02 TRINITY_DN25361_c0_g2_i1:189-794(-)
MFRAVWEVVNGKVAKWPLTAAIVFGGTKNFACDLAVQKSTTDSYDVRRAGLFTAFGLFYVGGVQYFIFNRVFPSLIPGLASQVPVVRAKSAACAVVLDNFIHIPMLYMPTFYTMRAFSLPEASELAPLDVVRLGYETYCRNIRDDVLVQGSILIPVQVLNFFFMPPHFRVPTTVCGGAIWVAALSYLRGGQDTEPNVERQA